MREHIQQLEQVASRVEEVTDIITRIGASVAVAPGAATIFRIEWWNENSAGVIALCAVAGAIVSVCSFLFGLWHSGKIGKVLEKMKVKRK